MRRIVFLISGPSHAPNLVCAIRTLRDHYDGRVDVFVWPESLEIVKAICADDRLNAGYIPWEPEARGRSATYVDKTRLIQSLPLEDYVLFLDADVLIHGSLDLLFERMDYGFVATQFNDWVSTGGKISKRIEDLRQFPEIDPDLIDQALRVAWPSVNSGIFGARPGSRVLPMWHEWTKAARNTFIPDEKTLHVLLPKFWPAGQLYVALGGRYNCSPMFQPEGLRDEDVIIRHFHGDCNLRPDKSRRGWELWRPELDRAVVENLGGIRDWLHDAGNKHLWKLLEAE